MDHVEYSLDLHSTEARYVSLRLISLAGEFKTLFTHWSRENPLSLCVGSIFVIPTFKYHVSLHSEYSVLRVTWPLH